MFVNFNKEIINEWVSSTWLFLNDNLQFSNSNCLQYVHEAVHKFQINAGGFGGEFDSARFTIPEGSESGEYIVHMIWGAYTDVVDVDVLPSQANDVYGRVSPDKNWERIEHCQ